MPVATTKTETIFYINADGHDPAALLDYAISFEDYLRTSEVVSTVAWTAYEDDGLTTTDAPFEINAATSAVPQAATVIEAGVTYTDCEIVWLTVEGATQAAKDARIGQTGIVTLQITTNQSRTDERSFKLKVANR